jgi:hypothetical protein
MSDAIDDFQYLTVVPLSFRFSTLHFSSNSSVWHGADFPLVSSPFFAFSPAGAKLCENYQIGGMGAVTRQMRSYV